MSRFSGAVLTGTGSHTTRGQAIAWPFFLHSAAHRKIIMNEKHSKARQTAEKAFSKTRVETASRERAFQEVDTIDRARQMKTSRLREARLAREAVETARVEREGSGTRAPSPKTL